MWRSRFSAESSGASCSLLLLRWLAGQGRSASVLSARSLATNRPDSARRSTSIAVASTVCSMRSSRRAISSLDDARNETPRLRRAVFIVRAGLGIAFQVSRPHDRCVVIDVAGRDVSKSAHSEFISAGGTATCPRCIGKGIEE